jgi:hypothetical protein
MASVPQAIHRNPVPFMRDRPPDCWGWTLQRAENRFAVWLANIVELLADTSAEMDRVVRPV